MGIGTVIILCAGEQERFDLSANGKRLGPKQLLPVNGISILHNTLDLLREYGVVAHVVTCNRDIVRAVQGKNAAVFIPSNRKTTCHSLLSTQAIWSENNLCLLGDVWYTHDAFSKMWADIRQSVTYYGSKSEIFAVRFANQARFISALKAGAKTSRGKLWESYRAFVRLPINQHEITTHFEFITDETDDVDTWVEYQRLLMRVK